MKLLLCLVLVITPIFAHANLLPLLAPDALVVVGDNAPPVEQQAAERLAQALRDAGGPADNLQLASKVNADLELAAGHHLLVVGTEKSNRVMERVSSHWALNRDNYFADNTPVHSYEPAKGFYLAGYGTFTAGPVGYIECDRNPYWHYATTLVGTTPKSGPLPYRQIIRLYGDSPAGVAAAVDAFLTRHLLTGPAVAKDQMPEAMSLWSIDTAHFAAPESAPRWLHAVDVKGGDVALIFAGWHLADSMTYAGFQEIAGLPAQKVWRTKFMTEKGWDYPFNVVIDPSHPMTRSPLFEATLARRASDNELFVAQLASPEQALQVRQAVETCLTKKRESHAPWSDVTANGVAWRCSKFGVHIAVVENCLVMESFDAAHDQLALSLVNMP